MKLRVFSAGHSVAMITYPVETRSVLGIVITRLPCNLPVHGSTGSHRGQTSEHARETTRGSHRSIRKTLHVAVTTAASPCELEAKYSFYFNEVHRR